MFLIWNERDMEAPVTQAIHALYSDYGRDFHGFNMGLQKDDERIRFAKNGRLEVPNFTRVNFGKL